MYMSEGSNSSTVFNWFVNITTVAGLIGWIVIEATYLRFYACLKKQGYSREGGFFLPGLLCGSVMADWRRTAL
jgi:amino acid transporter